MTRHGPGAGQYCPISRTLDVVGEQWSQWSLLVVRELLVGTTRVSDLARDLPGLSRTLLTPAGRALEPVVSGLAQWGAEWVFGDPVPGELDARLLVWWIHARLDTSLLGGDRQVLLLRFADDPRRFWIVIDHGIPSVCMVDPGYDVRLTIASDVATLYAVWLGRMPLTAALRSGQVRLDGSTTITRCIAQVLRLSPVAPFVPPAVADLD